MELKSDPKFDTINVTDIDIAFPGDLQTYTLREGVDSMVADRQANTLTITLGTAGTVLFNMKYAHWIAQRTRTIRVSVPAAQSATPTPVVPQPSTE